MASCRITSCHDQVGADVTLVAEEMLLEHCHDGDDTWLAAGGESVEFEVGGHERGREFGICCCSGARAPYLGRDVVEFFAVLDIDKIMLAKIVDYGLQEWSLQLLLRLRKVYDFVESYLVSHYGTTCCSSISGNDHAAIVNTADDSSTGGCGFGKRDALSV